MVKRGQKNTSNSTTTSGLSNNVFLMGLAIVFLMIAGMFFYIIDRPIIILGNSEMGIRQITGIEYDSTCRTNASTRLPPNPNVLEDPYVPPVKKTPGYIAPINTQSIRDEYTQVGILKRKSEIYRDGGNELIIPLMGRQLYSRRDKFQYYTISNTGNINTKLPIRHKGQNGMSEYGCDEIFSRDVVFVNGYDDYFIATIYENNAFIYTPNI
jgi:hypothetical protein